MLASVVYRLKAINQGVIPSFHGRKLHAVFFKLLARYDEDFATAVHDDSSRARMFTLSQLLPQQPIKYQAITRKKNSRIARNSEKDLWAINSGDSFLWRINLLDEIFFPAVEDVPTGIVLEIEDLQLRLEEIICDGSLDTGMLEVDNLLANVLSISDKAKKFEIIFDSPTTFRNAEDDYPFPSPEMIYGSLAMRFLDVGLDYEIDVEKVKEIAKKLLPQEWQGKSQRVYFASDRGALCFCGKITFALKRLDEDEKEVILLLTLFSVFSGIGRLTSQGFGQVKIKIF